MSLREKVDQLKAKVEKRGYFLNPDLTMTDPLVESLLVNEERYGYQFCPCRLASGDYTQDVDLICPCDYRDQDINEYGTCFCGLYVSQEVVMGKQQVEPIPERRESPRSELKTWRCNVCGYVSIRPHAPNICPICGVTHDRFEEYELC